MYLMILEQSKFKILEYVPCVYSYFQFGEWAVSKHLFSNFKQVSVSSRSNKIDNVNVTTKIFRSEKKEKNNIKMLLNV